MSVEFRHKRGDSFELAGQLLESPGAAPADLSGVVIRAQLRDGDMLVAELDTLITDAAQGRYRISKPYADTESWPVKGLALDVQFTWSGGIRRSSETVRLWVIKDVTLP